MKSCPFCESSEDGLRVIYQAGSGAPLDYFVVWCLRCGAQGPEAPGEAESVALWNARQVGTYIEARGAMPTL